MIEMDCQTCGRPMDRIMRFRMKCHYCGLVCSVTFFQALRIMCGLEDED